MTSSDLRTSPPRARASRGWDIVAVAAIVASGLFGAALALLPALLIGFVLLLRDVLGPTALPFGLVVSVMSWLAPDWGARAVALQALLNGFDAGLAAHLLRPVLLALCALAPAVAVLAPLGRLSRPAAMLWRRAALLVAGIAMRWGGSAVAWCLLPGVCVFALLAARLEREERSPL